MKNLIKPNALNSGDTVATVSLSWGGAGLLRPRYEQGKKQFEETFGVKIIEMTNSLKSPEELYNNPKLRLDDLMEAFSNKDVKAILTNIGGDETIRLLQYMNESHFETISKNPKIFMGMSDTTVNHFMCFKAGLSSFYSPSLMYGYAENCGVVDLTVNSTKKTLFSTEPIGKLPQSDSFIIDKLAWVDEDKIARPKTKNSGWRFIQGQETVQGRLLGGCVEVLNMINGTSIWPSLDEWEGAILFLETSEEMPSPDNVIWFLRSLGAQGILQKIKGILYARPGGEFKKEQQAEKEKWVSGYEKFDDMLIKVCKEFNCTDLPIVTNMDFGHTVPQFLLPYGALTQINPKQKTVSILESGVI